MKWLVSLILQCLLVGAILFSDIAQPIQSGLIILVIIANFWVAELLPLSVTALLVPVLASAFGIVDFKTALLHFAHPIIFLFLGGFALAAALHEHQLDRQLAQLIMRHFGSSGLRICLMLFSMTAFLSMWISNTATTVMMLPIALGLISHLSFSEHKNHYAFVLLGVAYSANIGGIATIVGSPPNAIAASALGLNFRDWLVIAMPISLLLLPCMWLLLRWLLKPDFSVFKAPDSTERFSWGWQKIQVLMIFISTAGLWIFGSVIQSYIGTIKDFDSWVAVCAIIVLHASKCLSWQNFEKNTQWGVLILFGGGLALSSVLSETGANYFLASELSGFGNKLGVYGLLLVTLLFVIFMTEISSNTALAALMIPTFMGIAEVMGFNQTTLVCGIAVAASCAFMLPVATPPNAIVFGSGLVQQSIMMKTGFVLNVFFSVLLSGYVFWFVH